MADAVVDWGADSELEERHGSASPNGSALLRGEVRQVAVDERENFGIAGILSDPWPVGRHEA